MMVLRWSQLREEVRRRVKLPGRPGSRAAGGRKAREVGEALEHRVAAAAEAQRAVVTLEGLPKCGAKFHGKRQAHPLPICCDFVGCVRGSGRGVFFDAKRCNYKILAMRLADPKIVKTHQADFLFRMAHGGAIAGLLVENEGITGRSLYYWLDGKHLGPGRQAVKWSDARWVVLGDSIDFGKLVGFYKVERS